MAGFSDLLVVTATLLSQLDLGGALQTVTLLEDLPTPYNRRPQIRRAGYSEHNGELYLVFPSISAKPSICTSSRMVSK